MTQTFNLQWYVLLCIICNPIVLILLYDENFFDHKSMILFLIIDLCPLLLIQFCKAPWISVTYKLTARYFISF